jgi:hypothetical protein
MEPTLVATTADHSLTVCCSYVEERNEDAPANASCFQSPHAPDRDGRQWKTSSLRKVTTSLSRLQVAEAQRHGTCTMRRMTDSDFGHAVGELLEMKMFLYVTPWTVCVLCTCREEVVFTRWLCIYTCMSFKKTNCIFWLIDIELLLMAKFVCHLNSSAGANWTRWINRVESIFLINRQKKERILNTFMSLGGGGSRCTLTSTCYRLSYES